MNAIDQIHQQLDALGPQADFIGGSHSLQASDESVQITCELTALGSLGCAFGHLTIESDSLADASMKRIQEISTTLAKKLTYLLEPVAPIESDAEGCVVQLRSQPPHRVENSHAYYELLVRRGGTISLRRFTKSGGTPREEVPASVTREVLGRLLDDLVAAIA